ncbi:MAG: YhbY family RNA-binding protein [Christensenellales bacterium]
MIDSKQRAALRAMANTLEPILYIGKAGVTDSVIAEADDALLARELIKGSVQQNAPIGAREALDALCKATDAQPVSASGRKFVLYRRNDKEPVIKFRD